MPAVGRWLRRSLCCSASGRARSSFLDPLIPAARFHPSRRLVRSQVPCVFHQVTLLGLPRRWTHFYLLLLQQTGRLLLGQPCFNLHSNLGLHAGCILASKSHHPSWRQRSQWPRRMFQSHQNPNYTQIFVLFIHIATLILMMRQRGREVSSRSRRLLQEDAATEVIPSNA